MDPCETLAPARQQPIPPGIGDQQDERCQRDEGKAPMLRQKRKEACIAAIAANAIARVRSLYQGE